LLLVLNLVPEILKALNVVIIFVFDHILLLLVQLLLGRCFSEHRFLRSQLLFDVVLIFFFRHAFELVFSRLIFIIVFLFLAVKVEGISEELVAVLRVSLLQAVDKLLFFLGEILLLQNSAHVHL